MRNIHVAVFALLSCVALFSQTGAQRQPKPKAAPQTEQATPQRDDLTVAREATDRFLSGLKIADLPEGRQLMQENQWITGAADNGQNFYDRPQFTEANTLFEKLFDADIPGVQGYERLLEMKAVSEAGTQILTRYWVIAFKDRRTGNWKVFGTGTGSPDFEKQVAFFASVHLYESDLSHYNTYAKWLTLSGRIGEARDALKAGLTASAVTTVPFRGTRADDDEDIERLQLKTMLNVIDAVVGN